MGAFAAGQVVLLPFPFSDLTRSKLRPALLLADAGRDDWIACQITSNPLCRHARDRARARGFHVGRLAAGKLCASGQIVHGQHFPVCYGGRPDLARSVG